MLYAQCSYIFGFYCTVGNQTPWCMKLYLFLLKQFKRNTSKYRLMILLIGSFLKMMVLIRRFCKSYYSIVHLTIYDVLRWLEMIEMFDYAGFISIVHRNPNLAFLWTNTFYMQRSTMVIVIIEEVKCTLRIVVNNCLMFQIPHVDNKVFCSFWW